MEFWRSVDRIFRINLLGRMKYNMEERLLLGMEEYGEVFQGDPLDHADEEVYDLVFYLEVLRKQREDLCHECKEKLGLD